MFAPRNMLGRRTPVAVVRPRVAQVAQSDNSVAEFNKCWDAVISGKALSQKIIQEMETLESVWGRLIEV